MGEDGQGSRASARGRSGAGGACPGISAVELAGRAPLMPLFRKRHAGPDDSATRGGAVQSRTWVRPGDLATGTVIAGYRITGLLGRGGMGVVYRAEHVHLGRPVAFKLLAQGHPERFRQRFVRESRVAASLSRPNTVTVSEAGEADGTLWIAMHLVPGTDLRRLLQESAPRDVEEVV